MIEKLSRPKKKIHPKPRQTNSKELSLQQEISNVEKVFPKSYSNFECGLINFFKLNSLIINYFILFQLVTWILINFLRLWKWNLNLLCLTYSMVTELSRISRSNYEEICKYIYRYLHVRGVLEWNESAQNLDE